jgi:hypothetical protein
MDSTSNGMLAGNAALSFTFLHHLRNQNTDTPVEQLCP